MAYSPTTWVAPAQSGGWRSLLSAATTKAANHSGTDGRPPTATAGRIGAHTEPRQMQMVCAGPPRSHRPQTGAWRSSSSVTIFNRRLGIGGALHRTSQTACNGGWSRWHSYPTGGPNLFGSAAVARTGDGHLELFVLGDDGALWHMWQTAPNNGWSQWVSHGAPPGLLLNSAPSVAAREDGRLDVFIVSQEAALWHIGKTAANSGWSDWVSLGSPSGVSFGSDSTAVVACSADGHLELFVVGNDGRLWQTRQTAPNGGWSGWRPHDAPSGMKFLRLRPAVASGLDGRLELFVVGDDASLWRLRHTGPNDGSPQWFSHGAPAVAGLAGSPAVAADADGGMQLFVMGTDGALWQLSQTAPNGGWSQWSSHGAPRGLRFLRRSPPVEGRLKEIRAGIHQGPVYFETPRNDTPSPRQS